MTFVQLIRGFRSAEFRLPLHRRGVRFLAVASDGAIILLASTTTAIIYHQLALNEAAELSVFVGLGMIVAAIFLPAMYMTADYGMTALLRFSLQTRWVFVNWLLAFPVMAVIAYTLKASSMFSRGSLLLFVSLGLALLILNRLLWTVALKRALKEGWLRGRRVALITQGSSAEQVAESLRSYGMRLTNRYQAPLEAEAPAISSWASDVVQQIRFSDAEEIYVSADWKAYPTLKLLLEQLRTLPISVHVLLDADTADLILRRPEQIGCHVGAEIHRPPLSAWEQVLKRSFDVTCAGAGLVLLSPLLVLVAIIIRMDSPGPVLFRQSRLGFNARPFKIFKFRTMTVMEDGHLITQATRQDSRVTRVGRYLRSWSVDELPQLLNVLRGEMSLIGPRPHALAHDEHYSQLIADYGRRQNMKPGLTGWAQANGYRGETPTIESMRRRIELDLWYVSNWSFWLDLRILFLTFIELLRSRAY